MIRVLVADDHPIVRSGIVGLLERADGIDVVGEAATGREALERSRALLPDLVLMDLRMPTGDERSGAGPGTADTDAATTGVPDTSGAGAGARATGADATAAITNELPNTRVLVLTTYESDDDILGAIEAGAAGYLLKAAPSEEIVAGVRAVIGGETVLAPSIATTLVGRMRQDRRSEPDRDPASVPVLSPRERDVLSLVAEGRSNPEIARALFLGEATVKSHLLHAFAKLGVRDRTRAALTALDLGLITRNER